MKTQSKQAIIRAFHYLLGGVVKLALRNGLTHTELSDICKALYVDIAEKEYGINGRPTNSSRIGLLTGLNRKDVKRMQTRLSEHGDIPPLKNSHISDVLSRWFCDPEYLDKKGKPKLLYFERGTSNFMSLVAACPASSDMQPTTILKELKRSKAIEELSSGRLKALKQDFVPNYLDDVSIEPEQVDADKITQGCSMLVDHMNTVFYNLYNHINDEPNRFELRASNANISPEQVEEFRVYIKKNGMDFLKNADKKLSDFSEINIQKNQKYDDTHTRERVGIGMYLIYDSNQKGNK